MSNRPTHGPVRMALDSLLDRVDRLEQSVPEIRVSTITLHRVKRREIDDVVDKDAWMASAKVSIHIHGEAMQTGYASPT